MTLRKGPNFPLPLGVIMLPLLIASLVGIIVFGFNIIFAEGGIKTAIISPDVQRNKNVWIDTAHANTAVSVPTAADRLPGNIAVKAEKPEKVVKTEPQNVKLAVPVGGTKSRHDTVRNTEPADAKPAIGVQSAADKVQTKATKPEPAKTVSRNTSAQNWQIQAGAFSVESSAVQVGKKITALGYVVKIVKTGTSKPISRVIVSPGKNRDAPNDALEKLNSIGIEGYIISGRP